MTIRERLLDLSKQRAALAQDAAKFEAERQQALAVLPAKFGFKTLNAFIKAVKNAAKPAPKPRKTYSRNVTRPVRPKKQANVAPVAVAALAPAVAVEAPPAPPAPPVISAPAAVPPASLASAPVGSDLNDPVNFGLFPDAALLEESTSPGHGYYDRLSAQLGFARKVLGTSGVPAAVWRQWRGFEQKAGGILRDRHQVPESL